ncbi:FK506-binding protein (FKBP)-type peptidyl-prolyl isomerase [Novymonas esmeraldas]|uniref:peptidylprolyl isomerase n=1 Tax=Novymonas esmeraldas TaxID=1808958 RepID=A0AAW0EW05_9TRYP
MSGPPTSSSASSVSDDSQPPAEAVYPIDEEVEVPGTDGGLHKTVLVEGAGTQPVKGAKVTVHYVGTLLDGTQFDSTRDRGEHYEFTLGRGQAIRGLDKGVATMRVGEKARLRCSPKYSGGAAGDPPTSLADSTTLFEVELLHWTREVDISPAKDKSLTMSVLKDGVDYENPAFESTVTMDLLVYIGEFDPRDTEHAPVKVMAGWKVVVGVTAMPPHLEAFLFKMRRLEAAACRVRSDLLREAVPEFGIPSSVERGHRDVTYVLELIELSRVRTYDFAGAAKIAEGEKRKNSGNDAFKAGNLQLAERFYRRAMEFIGEDYGFDAAHTLECHRTRISVMGNLAQVLLMGGKFAESAAFSQKVLGLDASNTKALFRLAKAQSGMQDWDESVQSIDKVLALEPGNADAASLRSHVLLERKAFDQKQKTVFKKMFA